MQGKLTWPSQNAEIKIGTGSSDKTLEWGLINEYGEVLFSGDGYDSEEEILGFFSEIKRTLNNIGNI